MKSDAWVLVILKTTTVIAVIAAAAFLLKRFVDKLEDSNQNEIDNWVDEHLAQALSNKLNRPVQQVLEELQHQNISKLNSEIQQIVQSVDLLFSKESSSQIMMKLSISYKDGSIFSITADRTWDSLPEIIRKDFLKTGSKNVHVPWEISALKIS
jgi:hypothetical protein